MNTYTVSERNNTIEIDGITFIINVSDYAHGSVTLEIPGGYAQDDDGDWIEIEGNYTLRTLYDDVDWIETSDQKFDVTITVDDIARARSYRAQYPEFVAE